MAAEKMGENSAACDRYLAIYQRCCVDHPTISYSQSLVKRQNNRFIWLFWLWLFKGQKPDSGKVSLTIDCIRFYWLHDQCRLHKESMPW